MNKLRRTLKLLPPAFIMRRWLVRKYGIKVKPSPWEGSRRVLLAVMPYAFTAVLSVRVDSDRCLLKYFLPYGKMKKFVRLKYNMQVGNDAKDCGLAGRFRAFMPYGLVLWWDAEDSRIACDSMSRKLQENAPNHQSVRNPMSNFGWRMPEREKLEFQRRDKIDVVALRLLIMEKSGDGV